MEKNEGKQNTKKKKKKGGRKKKKKKNKKKKNLKIEQKYKEGVNFENLGCSQQTQSNPKQDQHKHGVRGYQLWWCAK